MFVLLMWNSLFEDERLPIPRSILEIHSGPFQLPVLKQFASQYLSGDFYQVNCVCLFDAFCSYLMPHRPRRWNCRALGMAIVRPCWIKFTNCWVQSCLVWRRPFR